MILILFLIVDEILSVKPQVVAGWTINIEEKPLDVPIPGKGSIEKNQLMNVK